MNRNIYEILDDVAKEKTRNGKLGVLKKNACYALKNVLYGTYSPDIKFVFKEIPKYKKSDSPPGMGYSSISQELDRAYLFEENNPKVSPNLTLKRKEELLIQILESLENREAKIFTNMIMKNQNIKGLDALLVKEAFPDLPFSPPDKTKKEP